MKKYIYLGFCICCLLVLLTGCEILDILIKDDREWLQEPQETASIEGAREYLKIYYDLDIVDITLLEQVYKEEYKETIAIDGNTGLSKRIPAKTMTCYLGYSPEDDLYFLIFHDTVRQYYEETMGPEKMQIEKFAERINWAEDFFGEDFIGTDVDLYLLADFPLYTARELRPVFDSPDADVREAYNRLITDIENPFSSEYVLITENIRFIKADPYLNVYVNVSLSELDEKYEELADTYRGMLDVLIFATDGVYNRPYLNEARKDITTDNPE